MSLDKGKMQLITLTEVALHVFWQGSLGNSCALLGKMSTSPLPSSPDFVSDAMSPQFFDNTSRKCVGFTRNNMCHVHRSYFNHVLNLS